MYLMSQRSSVVQSLDDSQLFVRYDLSDCCCCAIKDIDAGTVMSFLTVVVVQHIKDIDGTVISLSQERDVFYMCRSVYSSFVEHIDLYVCAL